MTKKNICAIPECRNSTEKTAGADVIYQKFPTKEKIRRRWIRAIQATFKSFSDDASSTPRLCSDHFEESCFIASKSGKRIFKLDAVPTIFTSNVAKKQQQEAEVRPRHVSRRAASKEALKQMQILLEDEDDAVEIPDDDDEVVPIPVVVSPPKKKYKLTHRKSSDGNDREVLVLKSITPNITNHYVENNLELECWVEELEPCQKERNKKLEEEEKALQSKIDELIKACKGEVIYKGDLTTVIEVSEHVQKTIQAVQASHNKPPIVLNSTVATPQPGYQLVMDPRLGLIVGALPQAGQTPPKQAKIQVATNLQASVTPASQSTPNRSRSSRGKKQTPVVQPTPPPPPAPSPITTRSVLGNKQNNKRSAPQPPPAAPPATRSRGNEPSHQQMVSPSLPVTRSREPSHQQMVSPSLPVTRSREPAHQPLVATPPVTRSREPAHQPMVATPPVTRSRESVRQSMTPTPPVTRSREPVHQPVAATPPATRSREPVHQPVAVTPPVKRSREPPPPPVVATPKVTRSTRDHQTPAAPTPPVTRSRPGTVVANARPTESNVEGGLTTGTNGKPKAIVDLTTDDGRPLPDSREVSFNKLQGKTFPSLVVVARPHLRVSDINSDRAKLDSKVKAVLMFAPTKFTEWLIQQGLVKSEQKCSMHNSTQLKLGMYSDVSKFPYSGGYVWISECCPQRFVSVFSGSLFEGSPHPPLVILKILYHWACQTNIQNVTQWVKVDNLYVKGMYTFLRSICTVALQTHIRKLGGPQTKVEVGVISLGTTSQDGNSRQVKVEVLGILETTTKLIRLRAIEPLADGDRNYKKRFSKILEPLSLWVHPSSIIVTDLTVDKATLHQMGFSTVIQTTSVDANNSNRTIMEYLRRIVPRMFQNTLSLLSRQIIQQFLDELVWREWFGTTSMQAFDHLVSHLAEQTRYESTESLVVRLNRVALNPFRSWGIPATSNTVVPPAATSTPAKTTETVAKKRKRKEPEPQLKPTPPPQLEVNRPPKSTSPDVPEQMVPLENYYYGTIDNYPPKTNVTLNLKCPFCKEIYNNNIVLMNHLFKHAHNVSKDGQMCRYCLTSVPTANDLLKHIGTAHPSETKHDNGFVCLICETQYMNPFVLGKHMSKEHCPSELPYQCGTCGYRCSNHKQAIDHFYKQHDNGPTIQCPFCLKSTTVFSSSRNIAQNMHYFIQHLQKHQRKQFAKRCGKCNLWFVQKDVLKDHQTKMHASQRGKTGLVPWVAPRNGVMVPKSKMDKYPCDAEGINFTTLFYVTKGLKCKECDGPMDSTKHFPSFESCQNPNCQYSTCCSNAMQEHNAKCNKTTQQTVPKEKLPYEMFCICGYSSKDGNQMAKHLATCEKKSAYPSLSDSKRATVTHSMLDVLGLVRKPEETDKKVTAPSRTTKRTVPKSEPITITLDEDEPMEVPIVKSEKTRKNKEQGSAKRTLKNTVKATDASVSTKPADVAVDVKPKKIEVSAEPEMKKVERDTSIPNVTEKSKSVKETEVINKTEKEDHPVEKLTSKEGAKKDSEQVDLTDTNADTEINIVEDADTVDPHTTTKSNEKSQEIENRLHDKEGETHDKGVTNEESSYISASEIKSADLPETTNLEAEPQSDEFKPGNDEESVPDKEEIIEAEPEVNSKPEAEVIQGETIPDKQVNVAAEPEVTSEIEAEVNREPEGEINREAESELNPEPKVEPNSQNEAEVNFEGEAEVSPETAAKVSGDEAIPSPETKINPEDDADVSPEVEAEVISHGETEVSPQGEAEVSPHDEAEVSPQCEAEVSAQGEAEVCPPGEAEVCPQGEAEVCPQGEAEVCPQGEAEVIPMDEPEVNPEAETTEVSPEDEVDCKLRAEKDETDNEYNLNAEREEVENDKPDQEDESEKNSDSNVESIPLEMPETFSEKETDIEEKPDEMEHDNQLLEALADSASSSLEINSEANNDDAVSQQSETTADDKVYSQLQSDTFENISEKEDSQQLYDATSEISDLIENTQAVDQPVGNQIFPSSSMEEPKDLETLPSLLGDSEETRLEPDGKDNMQNIAEAMDYEDISNSGLDTLAAMETD